MGRKKIKRLPPPEDGHTWWKICVKCWDIKKLDDFPMVRHRKVLVTGQKRVYERYRPICDQCRNAQHANYRNNQAKLKMLTKSMNPNLHRYMEKNVIN
jgi:hypothetical protein